VSISARASRDVIIRTPNFREAVRFYESVLGLKIVLSGESLVGFDAGEFRLYVEKGSKHGPVFDFLVTDLEAAKDALLSGGCTSRKRIPPCRAATSKIPMAWYSISNRRARRSRIADRTQAIQPPQQQCEQSRIEGRVGIFRT